MMLKTALSGCRALLNHYVLRRPVPLSLVLVTNTTCNYQCSYCKIWARTDPELSTGQIESIIDQAARLGTVRLGLTGGEPLLRDDIGHIMSFARSRGLYVSLNTNGSLVEQRAQDLQGLDLLTLSFDGSEAAHDRSKKKGAYGHVLNAIAFARRSNIAVSTTTTLTRDNLGEVDFIVQTARERGFKAAFQLLHHPPAAAGDADFLLPPEAEYRGCLKKLIALKDAYPQAILNTRRYFEILLAWPDYAQAVLEKSPCRTACTAGELYCHIDVNGDVYPCHQLLKTFTPPNVLQMPLAAALASLPQRSCALCLAGDYLEYNLLFSLQPSAVMNAVKNL
jgi:MoaA/NifB/PqqE/SkfB family radical SAM enzyme